MRTRVQQKAREDVSVGAVSSGLAYTGLSEPSSTEPAAIAGTQDPLYLFVCYLEWHHSRNFEAYQELVTALDNSENRIREIAELLLHRISPRPQGESRGVFPK